MQRRELLRGARRRARGHLARAHERRRRALLVADERAGLAQRARRRREAAAGRLFQFRHFEEREAEVAGRGAEAVELLDDALGLWVVVMM